MGGVFRDRRDAGEALAARLARYAGRPDVSVLGLPRGGVPVAAVVAERLGAPLDVLLVRKVGHPRAAELALGAVASGGFLILNSGVPPVAEREMAELVAAARRELEATEARYRPSGRAPPLAGRTAILVDDGLATGASMRVALAAARAAGAARLVAAAPVAPAATAADLRRFSDEVVTAHLSEAFHSVSEHYVDFTQTSEDEVTRLLGGRA